MWGLTAVIHPVTAESLRSHFYHLGATLSCELICGQRARILLNMNTYGRFLVDGEPRYAEIVGETAHFIADLFVDRSYTGGSAPWRDLVLLPPVSPRKVFAIGLNYADHAAESGQAVPKEPLMWLKSPTAVIAHGATIEIVYPEHRTDYETELTIVIGATCKRVSVEEASQYIFGYTNAQDISDRVIQRGESQWTRAKSMDTYAPLGPFITTGVEPQSWPVQTFVNGELKQDSTTDQLIFSVPELVSFLSQTITLEAGDVILTGTPFGVGPLKEGDVVEARIGPLTPLLNPVRWRS